MTFFSKQKTNIPVACFSSFQLREREFQKRIHWNCYKLPPSSLGMYVNAIFFQIPHFLCHNLAKNRVFGFWKCLQKRNLNQGFSSYLAKFCHFWGFFKVYSIPNTLGNHSHMPKMKEKPCVQILFWLIPCIRKSNFS